MPFTVIWTPDAMAQLAEIWTRSARRNDVTRAGHRIDQALAVNPRQGLHRSEGLYSLYMDPLTAYYEIDDANAEVKVTAVASR